MTDDRKQELTQLLEEVMDGLKIGVPPANRNFLISPTADGVTSTFNLRLGPGTQQLPINILQDYLKKRWTSYGVDSSSLLMNLVFYITKDETESQLLDFIKDELTQFIHNGEIQSHSYAIDNVRSNELRFYDIHSALLSSRILLEHLLKIAIAWGVERAVSTFDDGCCPEGKQGFFQDISSLEGIVVEKDIQVYEGVRLVPFPHQTTHEIHRYIPDHSIRRYDLGRNMGKTLLIIDRPMLSIFHNPSDKTLYEKPINNLPFQVEIHDSKFANSDSIDSFKKYFCQALSLACNSAVQIARTWWFVAEDEIFHPFPGGGMSYSPRLHGGSVEADQSKIEEAKRLYEILTNKNIDGQEKLQIAIHRWIQSLTYQSPVDKMIDLGIAFESLYLPDTRDELTFKLGVRAAWYLEKNKDDRKKLLEEFKAIYKCRSTGVHEGYLKDTVTVNGETIPIHQFIERTQELCQRSITELLEDGEYPDWNDLILGE